MTLETATIALLVLIFVLAEFRRAVKGDRGVITEFRDSGIPLVASCACSVRVKLSDGREVEAMLDGCTACMGRLSIGDEVRVSKTRDGQVVTLPWLRSGETDKQRSAINANAFAVERTQTMKCKAEPSRVISNGQ